VVRMALSDHHRRLCWSKFYFSSVGKKKASGMCHHSTRPNSTHSFRGKHVKDILPQHVHGLNIEIEAHQ